MSNLEGLLLRIVDLIEEDSELRKATIALIEGLASDRMASARLKQLRIEKLQRELQKELNL